MERITHQNQLGHTYICRVDLSEENTTFLESLLDTTKQHGVVWLRDKIHGSVLRPVLDGQSSRKNVLALDKGLFPGEEGRVVLLMCLLSQLHWVEV